MAQRVSCCKSPALASSSILLWLLCLSVLVHKNHINGFTTVQRFSSPTNNIPRKIHRQQSSRVVSRTTTTTTDARNQLNQRPTVVFSVTQDDTMESSDNVKNQTTFIIAQNKEDNDNINSQKDAEQGNNIRKKDLISFSKRNQKKLTISTAAILLLLIGTVNRRPLLQFLSASINFSKLNAWLSMRLDRLNRAGNAGLILYTAMFCIWTMTVGITTPIETAAGFAFGAQKAIPANAIGKIGGAVIAFFLGRFIFYNAVQEKMKDNEMMSLVGESISERPLLVALMVRLSPLPEPVKNLGMSVLDVKTRYFALSVLLHGLPFTCLWSCMGAETARVVSLGVAPSATFKALISGSTWFGIFVSPTLIGWWIKSLREKKGTSSCCRI